MVLAFETRDDVRHRRRVIHQPDTLARARHWDEHILADLLASFLFLCVATLAATL